MPDRYNAVLREARTTGLSLTREGVARLLSAFKDAAAKIEFDLRSSGNPIGEARATLLREQVLRIIDQLEGRAARTIDRSVSLTIDEVAQLHEQALSAMFAAVDSELPRFTAQQFARLDVRVAQAMASRRGGTARTFQTLLSRNMGEAAPALDALLAGAVSRGVSTRTLTRDIADLLATSAGADLKPYGLQDQDVSGLRTLYYDSRRIAVTETLNALRETQTQALIASPLVAAVRWQVSGAHTEEDECDMLAEADLYGFGPGFYPPEAFPLAPHPFCACTQGEVILRPVDEWDEPREEPPEPDPEGLPPMPEDWSDARQTRAAETFDRATGVPYEPPEPSALEEVAPAPPEESFTSALLDFDPEVRTAVDRAILDDRMPKQGHLPDSPLRDLAETRRGLVEQALLDQYSPDQIDVLRTMHDQLVSDWTDSSTTNGAAFLKVEAQGPDNPTRYHGLGFGRLDTADRLALLDDRAARWWEQMQEQAQLYTGPALSDEVKAVWRMVADGSGLGADDLRAYIAADKTATEQMLRELMPEDNPAGPGMIRLYRGLDLPRLKGKWEVGSEIDNIGNSLSSWTTSTERAEEFGNVVVFADVPLEDVRMSYLTHGASGNQSIGTKEREFVIEAGNIEATVLRNEPGGFLARIGPDGEVLRGPRGEVLLEEVGAGAGRQPDLTEQLFGQSTTAARQEGESLVVFQEKTTTAAWQREVNAALDELPSSVREFVAERVDIYGGEKLTDILPPGVSPSPRTPYIEGSHYWDGLTGRSRVMIAEKVRDQVTHELTVAAREVGPVVKHEVGHSVDALLGHDKTGVAFRSLEPDFRAAWKADVEALKAKGLPADYGQLSYYARGSVETALKEAFAESFALLHGESGSTPWVDDIFRKYFKRTLKLTQQIIDTEVPK